MRAIAGRGRRRQNLTPRQLRAVDLYLSGERDLEVAKAVGVSRQTANGWRNRNPLFMDELQCRRNELTRVMQDQQCALAWKVMGVVSQALDEGNAKVALEIGKSLGLFLPVQLPMGPETIQELRERRAALQRTAALSPEEIRRDRERRAQVQARAEAQKAYMDELSQTLIPIDVEVYERRLAELLEQNGCAPRPPSG